MSDQPPGAGSSVSTAAPPTPSAAPQNLRILSRFSIVAALFAMSLGGSWWVHSNVSLSAGTADDPDPPHHSIEAKKSVNPAILRSRGDNALRQHRFVDAIAHYQELMGGERTDVPALNYRLGLCSEFVGQTEKACAYYRLAIAASAAPPLRFAAQLAMARCLLRQDRPAEARRLLQAPLLDETHQFGVPQPMLIDAYFLSALALARENAAHAPARLAQDDLVSSAAAPSETPLYLDDLDALGNDAPAVAKADRLVVQPRAGIEPAMVFAVEREAPSASDLLDQLAHEGGMKTEWTPSARKSVAQRALQLCLHNWELRDVLEHTCDFLDLVCEFDIDGVRIFTAVEADRKMASAFRRRLAQRAVFSALHADADHVHVAACLLELGNLEAGQERWQEAVYWFGRVGLDHSSSPHALAAHFNRAQVHLHQHDAARARKALFRVIDQAPGHELALRGGIQLAQLFLQENDTGQAIVHLRRTQQLAGKSTQFPVATLMLAAAQLNHAEFDAARRTLLQNRAALDRDPFKKTAAFLDTYARYRLALESADAASTPNQRESNELIATLWRNKDETHLGAYGYWLMAQAYHDLGFWDQAERVLRRAAREAQTPFNIGVELTLAETLLKKNRRTDAGTLYEKWAQVESPFRGKARQHLAQFHYDEKHFTECTDWCQKLWTDREYADKSELLRLWGAALENCGEYAKAAQCFAGKAPE